MLVNLKEVLKIAQNENIAIGSFNIYNLETILALKEAVLKTKKPVIVDLLRLCMMVQNCH